MNKRKLKTLVDKYNALLLELQLAEQDLLKAMGWWQKGNGQWGHLDREPNTLAPGYETEEALAIAKLDWREGRLPKLIVGKGGYTKRIRK